MLQSLCIVFFNILFLHFTSAHDDHPNPTYFRRFAQNGQILDRLSKEYSRIENKARLNRISRYDANTIKLETNPHIVQNGGNITLTWKGVVNPDANDYIAYYCPYNDEESDYIDYFYVKEVAGWQNGGASCNLTLHNMRSSCIFKYYRNTETRYVLAAVSNKINFHNGGPYAPTQGHISMTNKPTEMRVMWVSANITQAVVRYGRTPSMLSVETRFVSHTYKKDDMCEFPATSDLLFRDPGYIYDVLLRNLVPNTLYYYSYGNGQFMSPIANFTTPLPKGDQTPFKFIVYGDMGIHFWPGQAKYTAQNVRREVSENDIKFVFHHGDISYARGIAYLWEMWFRLTEPYATLVPYMVGIGNHEYDHTSGGIGHDPSNVTTDDGWRPDWFNGGLDSGGECAVPTYYRYHMPDNGNSLFWYSFDYGLVHMIMMSTEHDFSPGSPQYKWLEKDLASVNRTLTPWVLIGGHRAMYCSAMEHGEYIVGVHMQVLLEDLLFEYNVDIAFWAHYHLYERTCKVFRNKCVDNGITHLTVGSGGFIAAADFWYNKEWSIYHKAEYGYGRVTVANSTALLFEWIHDDDGKVKDHVWLYK